MTKKTERSFLDLVTTGLDEASSFLDALGGGKAASSAPEQRAEDLCAECDSSSERCASLGARRCCEHCTHPKSAQGRGGRTVIEVHGEAVDPDDPPRRMAPAGAREWLADQLREASRVKADGRQPDAAATLSLLLSQAAMPTAEALEILNRCTVRKPTQ